ncbi:MAG: response regulator [Anaerolineae bacterium]|nr:response regulator [Anaerolineae bacterium]
MTTPLRVLILEDRPADAELMVFELEDAGFAVRWRRVETEADYVGELRDRPDLILADYTLPQFNALRALRLLQEHDLDIPFIVVTGTIGEEAAVQCMKLGAADYLLKDRLARLGPAVANVLQEKELRDAKRQAEAALRAANEQLSATLNALPDMLLETDRHGKLYDFRIPDPESAFIFPPEFLGQTVDQVLPPEAASVVMAAISEAVESGRHAGAVYPLETAAGRRWFELSIAARGDPQAPESRLIALVRDVTVRQQAEDDLQQQLTRIGLLNRIARAVIERQDLDSIYRVVLRRLEDYLPIGYSGVYSFDPVTDTLVVLGHGPGSHALAEQVGLLPGKVLPVDETGLRACLQGQMVYVPDLSQVDASFARKWTRAGMRSAASMPLAVHNRVFGILFVARSEVDAFDCQERDFLQGLSEHVSLAAHQAQLYLDLQQAYDELRQTQQAMMQQERLQALGHMASGIAHDVNNTLSPVVIYTELLMREPGLSDHALQWLQIMQTACDDITQMVSRMREFYRQRAEQEDLLAVDPYRVLQQAIDLTRPYWRDTPQHRGSVVTLRTNVEDNLPTILGIEGEIREALTNLIINAVDAMPDGGALGVRAYVRAQAGNDLAEAAPVQILLEVSDTGIGMDKETKSRCLEPFFSTKGELGTGLGLSVVYGIMQRHDGGIEIDSAPGRGTTVRLVFPVREQASADETAAREAGVFAPLRILCVDDELLLREALREMLENAGHEVAIAAGGQEGLDAFREAQERGEPFDVVITDLGMPYVDGRQVVETIKRQSPLTPVVILTGWGIGPDKAGSPPLLADHILSKPPKKEQIDRVLAQVQGG